MISLNETKELSKLKNTNQIYTARIHNNVYLDLRVGIKNNFNKVTNRQLKRRVPTRDVPIVIPSYYINLSNYMPMGRILAVIGQRFNDHELKNIT